MEEMLIAATEAAENVHATGQTSPPSATAAVTTSATTVGSCVGAPSAAEIESILLSGDDEPINMEELLIAATKAAEENHAAG